MAIQLPSYGAHASRPRFTSASPDVAGGRVNYSPLSDALWDIADLFSHQVAGARRIKQESLTANAALDVRRTAFEMAADGDPATRPDRFLAAKQEIKDAYLKQIDELGGSADAFAVDFEQAAMSEEFSLRKASSVELEDQKVALFESTLHGYTQLAGEGDPEQTAQFRQKGIDLIQRSLADGTITARDAVKTQIGFLSGVIETRVRRDIMADPHLAERSLLAGEYGDLDPDKRVSFLNQAGNAAEREERRGIAAEDRAIRLQDKAERQRSEAVAKQGDRLAATGELTPTWIENNRDDLNETDYRHFYKELNPDAATVKDNPEVYADLRLRAGRGELTRPEARSAYQGGQITRDSFDRLTTLSEESDPTTTRGWIKNGESYIGTALKPSDLNPTPGAPQTLALALDEWRDWTAAHRDAAPEEARKVYRGIVEQHSLTQFEGILNGMKPGQPELAAVQTPADLDQAEHALVEEFLAAHGGDEAAVTTDPEFVKRSDALRQLREAAAAAIAASSKPAGGPSFGPR